MLITCENITKSYTDKILLDNQDIKKMFDAEVRFDVLVGDMYRIIGEAIREAMED